MLLGDVGATADIGSWAADKAFPFKRSPRYLVRVLLDLRSKISILVFALFLSGYLVRFPLEG